MSAVLAALRTATAACYRATAFNRDGVAIYTRYADDEGDAREKAKALSLLWPRVTLHSGTVLLGEYLVGRCHRCNDTTDGRGFQCHGERLCERCERLHAPSCPFAQASRYPAEPLSTRRRK